MANIFQLLWSKYFQLNVMFQFLLNDFLRFIITAEQMLVVWVVNDVTDVSKAEVFVCKDVTSVWTVVRLVYRK